MGDARTAWVHYQTLKSLKNIMMVAAVVDSPALLLQSCMLLARCVSNNTPQTQTRTVNTYTTLNSNAYIYIPGM